MSNKMSSKLAAGVRKVRERETAVPAKTKPAADRREEAPTVKADQAKSGAALHPARVWPD
ncbi:MAG: hypothetical protein K0B16_15180 [Burkholderiaceae bacterium]|nr:hypothetical protein [Burkholderiaceae bacterium]